jgi:hypothetical protein
MSSVYIPPLSTVNKNCAKFFAVLSKKKNKHVNPSVVNYKMFFAFLDALVFYAL